MLPASQSHLACVVPEVQPRPRGQGCCTKTKTDSLTDTTVARPGLRSMVDLWTGRATTHPHGACAPKHLWTPLAVHSFVLRCIFWIFFGLFGFHPLGPLVEMLVLDAGETSSSKPGETSTLGRFSCGNVCGYLF